MSSSSAFSGGARYSSLGGADRKVVAEQVVRVEASLQHTQPIQCRGWEGVIDTVGCGAGVEAQIHAVEEGGERAPSDVKALIVRADRGYREVGGAVSVRGRIRRDIGCC